MGVVMGGEDSETAAGQAGVYELKYWLKDKPN